MSEDTRISRRGLVLFSLAVMIVAFLGVIMGNWYISKRQAQIYQNQVQNVRQHSACLIKPGDYLPAVELLDLDSQSINLQTITGGSKTLILTLSPGCKPCAMTIAEWKGQFDKLPQDLRIIGIIDSDPAEAAAYRDEADFLDVIYCDTAHILASLYGLEAFPSVIGIDSTNHVSFIREGWLEGFTPLDAYEIFNQDK